MESQKYSLEHFRETEKSIQSLGKDRALLPGDPDLIEEERLLKEDYKYMLKMGHRDPGTQEIVNSLEKSGPLPSDRMDVHDYPEVRKVLTKIKNMPVSQKSAEPGENFDLSSLKVQEEDLRIIGGTEKKPNIFKRWWNQLRKEG